MENKANEEEYYLNALLEEEILKSDQLSTEEWMDMYEIYASKLLKFVPVEKLTKRSRLCIAMVIVGAKVLSMYPVAFRIIWEGFQSSSGIFDSEKVKLRISKILPTVVPSFVTHVKLREKLSLLSTKILLLVARLENIDSPKAALDVYCKKYPLDEYVKWFLIWAYSLLRKPTPSKSASKCQQGIHFVSILKPKISSNLPTREVFTNSMSRAKDKGDYCHKTVSGNPSNKVVSSSSSKKSTFNAGNVATKSIRLSQPPPSQHVVVASDGFRTPELRVLRASPFSPAADEVQATTTSALEAVTSTEQLTISRRAGNTAAMRVEESVEMLQVTVAALSAIPKLSKQEKIQQLFLSHRSTSDGTPLVTDGDCVRATDEGEDEGEESLSTLSYASSLGSSTACSADDNELPADSHMLRTETNGKSASSGIRSPSFIPYNATAVAEDAEDNRKRGLFLDGADDEGPAADGRPSWRDAKRRRFYYHHPTAGMTLSERIGHLIWEMFSPRSGAGADSDSDGDGDQMS
eukprot:gene26813-35503_t